MSNENSSSASFPVCTGYHHWFAAKKVDKKLRVRLLGGLTFQPITGDPCKLDEASLTTDGGGIVEKPINPVPKDAGFQALEIEQGFLVDLTLQVGSLKPHDTDDGWKARLFNLGFLLVPDAQPGSVEMGIALADFQAQYGLPVTGEADDDTKAKIKEVYGC